MASANFVQLFRTLESYGLTDALLPFVLIFTIIFAMLQKTRILGDGKKNFNAVIALAIALLVVIPHITGRYPANGDIVKILNDALPQVSVVVVAILMMLLIIGLLGGEAKWMGGSISAWFAVIAFGLIIFIFGGSAGWWERLPNDWVSQDTTVLVIALLVFAIIVWYVTKDDSAHGAAKAKHAFDSLGDFFKGGGGGGGGHH